MVKEGPRLWQSDNKDDRDVDNQLGDNARKPKLVTDEQAAQRPAPVQRPSTNDDSHAGDYDFGLEFD